MLNNNGDNSDDNSKILTITFSYVALLEKFRNGLNDVITNETFDKNDFRISVSNIELCRQTSSSGLL